MAARHDKGEMDGSEPRWREDFPIRWEGDHYVTRRELAKFLTLGSALLVGANAAIAVLGLWKKPVRSFPESRIASERDVPPGGSLQFRYPTDEDPCILLRSRDGQWNAYSQVCTHLSCAVIHTEGSPTLDCPCHKGVFSCDGGMPIAGPPTRRLPRILLAHREGAVFAVGVEL